MFTVIALLLSVLIVVCLFKGTRISGKYNHWDRLGMTLTIPTIALWMGIGVLLMLDTLEWIWRHAP